jgi:hypothetical protein
VDLLFFFFFLTSTTSVVFDLLLLPMVVFQLGVPEADIFFCFLSIDQTARRNILEKVSLVFDTTSVYRKTIHDVINFVTL